MRVNREDLLAELEAVQPGLAAREVIEQSACIVFREGKAITFNDEIACSHKVSVDVEGAVRSEPLMNLLRKLKEETIDVRKKGDELRIRGKSKESAILMESEITLPVDDLEQPKKWYGLNPKFGQAVDVVKQCTGKDESQFILTCVHVTPQFLEASDNHQLIRYKMKTGIKKPCLVRRDSIKHVVSMGMTQVSETKAWIHFRNPNSLVMSCRRDLQNYIDMSAALEERTGKKTTLPKGLIEAAETAEIFSGDNAEDNSIEIMLRPGKVQIKGAGVSGWHREVRKLTYKGKSMDFLIAPGLLCEIVERYNDCIISDDQLRVNGGAFTYITALEAPEDEEDDE